MAQSMIEVQRTISMGHRLPSYDGICSSPHGHNVRVVLRVLTEDFLDFKLLDAVLRDLLEDYDHAMVLWAGDSLLSVLREMNFRTVAMNVEPTTENVAQLLFNELTRALEGHCIVASVAVYETDKYAATASSAVLTIQRTR